MALVISDKRVSLLNHETITKTIDDNGTSRTLTEHKEVDRVLLESGVQKQVPEWVLENEHFKVLVADGSASAIAYQPLACRRSLGESQGFFCAA